MMPDFKKTITYTATILFFLFILGTPFVFANEGTRHITGSDVDIYFMNDKVFGTVSGYPLWAIYNCGKDINGELSHNESTQKFSFLYNHDGNPLITGSFGNMHMALDGIKRRNNMLVYTIEINKSKYTFSIRYERIDAGHMINSLIEGHIDGEKKINLTVDGHLCPFATTGIILIVAGAILGG